MVIMLRRFRKYPFWVISLYVKHFRLYQHNLTGLPVAAVL